MGAELFGKVETREFTVKDIEHVLGFQLELKGKKSYSSICEEMLAEVLNEVQRSESLFGRVAYLGEQLVGFIIGDVKPKWYFDPESAQLVVIFVHPDYRRKGIGRRLLVEFLEQVRELKLKKVYAMSGINDEETLCFLMKTGFKRGRFVQLEKQV